MDVAAGGGTAPRATVWIGLGLNLPPHRWRWQRLVERLGRVRGFELAAVAPPRLNPAVGPGVCGRFLNSVAVGRTGLSPRQLLSRLKHLERQLGRRPGDGGDRPADLDLLLWHERGRWRRLTAPGLVLPHPRAAGRPFVMAPLLDLKPPRPLPPALERVARSQNRKKY